MEHKHEPMIVVDIKYKHLHADTSVVHEITQCECGQLLRVTREVNIIDYIPEINKQ